MKFRFVHAADLHLDTPFEGIAQDSPQIAQLLRDASLEAFDGLIELTIRERAAFLLLAGDIYDGVQRGIRAQARFERGLRKLAENGIRAFVVQGNHDPLESWSSRCWPDNVCIFGADAVRAVAVERVGLGLATIHGISFSRPDVTENLTRRFAAPEVPGLHIGLLHCSVGSANGHAPYSPCSLADLQQSRLDYWALGHIHRHEFLCRERPWVVYPGNLQGRSAKPSETGPKGACVVEVEDGGIRAVRFAALDRVRFVRQKLSVEQATDLGTLHELLERAMDEARGENGGRAILLRVELVGRCPIHRILSAPGAMEGLLRDMRQLPPRAGQTAWWEGIQNHTQPLLDLASIRRRQDFSAELMGFVEQIAADPQRRDELADSAWDAMEKRGLARWLAQLEMEQDPADVFSDAQNLALDRLEEEAR